MTKQNKTSKTNNTNTVKTYNASLGTHRFVVAVAKVADMWSFTVVRRSGDTVKHMFDKLVPVADKKSVSRRTVSRYLASWLRSSGWSVAHMRNNKSKVVVTPTK